MKLLSVLITAVLAVTVGLNLYALISGRAGDYVFWCNLVTGIALFAMMLLVILRKKKLQALQQAFIDRFFSRN